MRLAEPSGSAGDLHRHAGRYPGVGSEERNQSEAIARNLFEMALLRVPVVSVVIGGAFPAARSRSASATGC